MKSDIKEILYKNCDAYVAKKLQTIESTILSNKNALHSETKSSAGDKHETGRAMLQLEMEKAGQQLKEVQQMKLLLEKVNIKESSDLVRLGTIIFTNNVKYFLAISVGKITIEGDDYFAISSNSPIGRLLLGKKVGDSYFFQGKNLKIDKVL